MARIVQRELASTSDGVAPSFIFNTYEVGKTYYNNGSRIDFVTYDGNLYVPTSEENIARTEDPVDSGFLLIVRKGKQGNQGLKGNPGRDGRTPSVFASFDGKQMRFFTDKLDENGNVEKDSNGNPVRKMIGQTNDLTGPSWRPKIIDNTIVWEKTRDDSQPESVNLSDFIQKTSPVLFRVNSDNTRRMDEMDESGPANYIQWKYEGDEYWNNLISISELMNLALAGICIDKDPDDGLYHLYHKQVLKAEYTATPNGKKIISDVEHGDWLYDAGPIPGKNYDLEIHQLTQDTCDLKRRVRNIENELPKFVKSVTVNGQKHRPDEDQNVTLPDYYSKEESDNKYQPKGNYQPAGDYIKKSDLRFEVKVDPADGKRYLYVSMDGGNTLTKVMDATCACDHGDDPTPTEIPVTGVTLNCPDNALVVGTSQTLSYTVAPSNATNKNVTFSSSNTNIATVTNTGRVTPIAAGTVRITVTTIDGGNTDSCDITVNNSEPTPVTPTSVEITNCAGDLTVGDTEQLNYRVLPSNADQSVTFSSNNTSVASVSSRGLITAKAAGEATITVSTNTGNKTATCTVVVVNAEPSPVTEYRLILTPGESEISIDECTTITADLQKKEAGSTTWTTIESNVNASYHSGSSKIRINGNEICGIESGQRIPVSGRYYYQGQINAEGGCEINVTDDSSQDKYALVINKDGGSVKVSINNGTAVEYEEALQLNENDSVKLTLKKEGYSGQIVDISSDTTPLSPNNLDFTMIKNTNLNVQWTLNKYKLYLKSYDTPNERSIIVNNEPIELNDEDACEKYYDHGTDITISANCPGYTATIKVDNTEQSNPYTFTMTKDTSVNITWTKDEVTVESITLDSSDMNLTYASCIQNQTGSRTAIVNYSDGSRDNSVTWSVPSDQDIISISDTGIITPLKVSSSPVTVTVSAGNKTATFKVYVSEAHVEATSVNITEEDFEMNIEEIAQLHATAVPACAQIIWTAESNPSGVVSINRNTGKVTANNAGTATVYANSEYGDDVYDVVHITVNAATTISAVTIDPSSMDISVSDTSTSRLRAIVSGTGDYNKAVTWEVTKDGTSTDGLTLTPGSLDESGNYTAEIKGNVAGQYTVRAISVQDTNISGQCTILVLGETKNVRLINNSPWTVNYSVGNSSSTITASDTKELGTVSEDMTIQRVYPDQAKTYFTLENGTNTYSQSGNMSDSYSGDNWIISYADLQSGDIIIDYETGIGPILP